MSRSRIHSLIALIVLLLFATMGNAVDSPDDIAGDSAEDIKQRIGTGDPVAGKLKSLICQACHGADGNPVTPDCPKLSGQYAAYIVKEIRDFQKGSRRDPIMTDVAMGLTNEQDLLDIAAYFASQPQMVGDLKKYNAAGHKRFTTGNGCQTCHGYNGKGLSPGKSNAPIIGGQHKAYLVKQLKDFRSNARTNEATGIMGMVAAMMSDEQIDDVASYESGL